MWEIHLLKSTKKELDSIPESFRHSIEAHIEDLKKNPRPQGVKKLEGRNNRWRIRTGSYRIIYKIDDKARIVLILKVSHRKDAYRMLRLLML